MGSAQNLQLYQLASVEVVLKKLSALPCLVRGDTGHSAGQHSTNMTNVPNEGYILLSIFRYTHSLIAGSTFTASPFAPAGLALHLSWVEPCGLCSGRRIYILFVHERAGGAWTLNRIMNTLKAAMVEIQKTEPTPITQLLFTEDELKEFAKVGAAQLLHRCCTASERDADARGGCMQIEESVL